MRSIPRPSTLPSAASSFPWMLNLATRMLAGLLNMPEPLLRSTGVFVFVHVQAVETGVGNKLCPIRLLRQFLASRRQAGASIPRSPTPTREGDLP